MTNPTKAPTREEMEATTRWLENWFKSNQVGGGHPAQLALYAVRVYPVAMERVRVLEEALGKYGDHTVDCNEALTNPDGWGEGCTCGLADLTPTEDER